eukprot:403362280
MLSEILETQMQNGNKRLSKKQQKQIKHLKQLEKEQERVKFKNNGAINSKDHVKHKRDKDVLQILKENFSHTLEEDIINMVYEECG